MIHLPQRFVKDIHSVIDILLTHIEDNLVEIILFGSCARGEVKTGSDIDLLVLTHKSIATHEARGYIRDLVDEYNVDLVFYAQDVFEASTSLFVNHIKRDGISLWKEGTRCETI